VNALALLLTTAGLERFTAAQVDDDIDLTISSVGLTNSTFVMAPSLTALPGQFRAVNTISGDQVGSNIVHLMIRDEAEITYTVRGFGLYLDDGTLFAVYGQEQPIFEKAVGSTMLIALDIAFPTGNVDALTFGDTNFLNPPATTERQGVVELSTAAEAVAGVDAFRAVTPAALRAAIRAAIDANDKIGTVKLWWGDAGAVAAGWAICNGQTVTRSDGAGNITTPDLRDRVPVGASATRALGATFGSDEKTVNTELGGAHTPSGIVPSHGHGIDLVSAESATGASIATTRHNVDAGASGSTLNTVAFIDASHSHGIVGETEEVGPLELNMDPVPAHQHDVTIDVTQPSLALHFIMRV
jgi:hypothetical protein